MGNNDSRVLNTKRDTSHLPPVDTLQTRIERVGKNTMLTNAWPSSRVVRKVTNGQFHLHVTQVGTETVVYTSIGDLFEPVDDQESPRNSFP